MLFEKPKRKKKEKKKKQVKYGIILNSLYIWNPREEEKTDVFEDIKAERFPKSMKDMKLQIQKFRDHQAG